MLRSFIAQFEKRDKEGSSREKLLEENISSLTMEIVSIKKALIFAEKSLLEREIELQSALGGFNEKGEELDIFTAQVIIYYYTYFYYSQICFYS